MIQYVIMGRRSFWYNLSKAEQENIYVDNIIEMLNAHNNAPFEQRGEGIDTCYLFDHCYQDDTTIKWLYFSSGGGDWNGASQGCQPVHSGESSSSGGVDWNLARAMPSPGESLMPRARPFQHPRG